MSRKIVGIVLVVFGLLGASGGFAADVDFGRGPIQMRNQYPPHLMFLTPRPETALLLPARRVEGALAIDYSSVYVNSRVRNFSALIDMEAAILTAACSVGVTPDLTVSARVPLVSMNEGFMDGFLENYHEALGLPNYGREKRSKNSFAYDLRKNGQSWFDSASGGLHLADSTLSAKLRLFEGRAENPLSASLMYTLKVPTGDPDHGFGSGGWDHGLFLLSAVRWRQVVLHFGTGGTLLASPDTMGPEIEVQPTAGLLFGAEYVYSQALSIILQIDGYTSPLRDTGVPELDNSSMQLGLGFQYGFGRNTRVTFALGEDLAGRCGPDFTMHLSLEYTMGGPLW